jgi:predicted nucleic acid-binding Zn ribbon protein
MGRKQTDKVSWRGRWQVQRERDHIGDAAPPPPFRESAPVGNVLPPVLKKLGLSAQVWLQEAQERWPELVGKAVAAHTRVGRFFRGHVVVYVDSSVWLAELSRGGKAKMLANLREAYGSDVVRSLSLQLDADRGRPPRRRGGAPGMGRGR